MKHTTSLELKKSLEEFGEKIRVARIRRDLSAEAVAQSAEICRSTVIKIEKGCEGVAIGYYLRVLAVLGLDGNLISVVLNDPVGYALFQSKIHTPFPAKEHCEIRNTSSNKCGEIKKKMYQDNNKG